MQFSGSGTDAQAVEDRRVAGAVEAEIFGSHAQGAKYKKFLASLAQMNIDLIILA